MKVFIRVDMEGISGLVRWADVVAEGQDYALNRMILTGDANAAIEGPSRAVRRRSSSRRTTGSPT